MNIPGNSKILFRRYAFALALAESLPWRTSLTRRSSFDDDQISLTVYQDGRDKCPYLLLRIFDDGAPWYSLRGAHELCIEQYGSSLQFKRWSNAERRPKTWAVLAFATWEGELSGHLELRASCGVGVPQAADVCKELVLLHATFVSLKARNNLTVQLGPKECTLQGESKHFQA